MGGKVAMVVKMGVGTVTARVVAVAKEGAATAQE